MHPDVSVIICAYNAEKYIAKSIESALSQGGVTLELVLVNDDSTDNTLRMMKQYASRDSRIVIIENQQNFGLSVSRNVGARASSGEWITPLDADDWYGAGRLARLVEAGRRHQVEMVADDMYCVPQGYEHKAKRLLAKKFQDVETLATLEDFIRMSQPWRGVWGYMQPLVRRDFLIANNLGYDEQLRVMEDWDYWMRCLLHGARLLVVGEPYYYYLIAQRAASLSRADSAKKRVRVMIEITQRIIELAKSKNHAEALELLKTRKRILGSIDSYLDFSTALKSYKFGAAIKNLARNPFSLPLYFTLAANSLWERVSELAHLNRFSFTP